MTVNTSSLLLAQSYAALHQLDTITFVLDDTLDDDELGYVDRELNSIHIRPGASLPEFIALAREGILALCGGATVIERDDGETGWSGGVLAAVAGDGIPVQAGPVERPRLRLV